MNQSQATMLLVGDIILGEPNPDWFFELSAPVLRAADVVVGQVEVPHTARGIEQDVEIPAAALEPERLSTLAAAGFTVATLAGNHTFDAGAFGVQDTIETLRSLGIATVGAGMNLAQARKPVIIERKGLRLGFLSYNCVGPEDSWASAVKPGAAYVQIITSDGSPSGPSGLGGTAEPRSLAAMVGDISRLRSRCDVLTVALHKGIGHTRARLAKYDRQVAHAAVDAGADVVIGHHPHILKGIEMYEGKPVFHGLGNFVAVTRSLSVTENSSPARLAWARRRRELFGFEPDPDYPVYFPWHPEAKNTIIARCLIDGPRSVKASFMPCFVNRGGQPEVLGYDGRGQQVFDYVQQITREAGLETEFSWDGDVIGIRGRG